MFDLSNLHAKENSHIHQIEEIYPAKGGLSNYCYLVRIGNTQYVLKINPKRSHPFVLRNSEKKFLEFFGNTDLAPRLIECGSKPQYLLLEYIEGQTLSGTTCHRKNQTIEICRQMKKLHRSSLIPDSYNIIEDLEDKRLRLLRSYSELDCAKEQHILEQLKRGWDRMEIEPKDVVPCHFDINPENLIIKPTGEIAFIDWEYARFSPVYFEMANFFNESNLSRKEESEFLREYFSENDKRLEIKVRIAQCILCYYWFFWSLYQKQQGLPKVNYEAQAKKYYQRFLALSVFL